MTHHPTMQMMREWVEEQYWGIRRRENES